MPDLSGAREVCESWDESLSQCDEEYPDGCPFATECKTDAESEVEDDES